MKSFTAIDLERNNFCPCRYYFKNNPIYYLDFFVS